MKPHHKNWIYQMLKQDDCMAFLLAMVGSYVFVAILFLLVNTLLS